MYFPDIAARNVRLACQDIARRHSVSVFGGSSDILCPGYLGQDFVILISVLAASDACENHAARGG